MLVINERVKIWVILVGSDALLLIYVVQINDIITHYNKTKDTTHIKENAFLKLESRPPLQF